MEISRSLCFVVLLGWSSLRRRHSAVHFVHHDHYVGIILEILTLCVCLLLINCELAFRLQRIRASRRWRLLLDVIVHALELFNAHLFELILKLSNLLFPRLFVNALFVRLFKQSLALDLFEASKNSKVVLSVKVLATQAQVFRVHHWLQLGLTHYFSGRELPLVLRTEQSLLMSMRVDASVAKGVSF
jgi:hypothetical protein